MKKRAIAIFLLVIMACGMLLACSKKDQDLTQSKYLGTWKGVSVRIGSETEAFDEECILVLNPDGTARFSAGEEASNCTWTETKDGFKLVGDTKMTFKADGDKVTTKLVGLTLEFEKQP